MNNKVHAIYYVSKTLNGAQANYDVFEKKLLVVVYAFENFRFYLVGSKMIVYRCHLALKLLLTMKDAKMLG